MAEVKKNLNWGDTIVSQDLDRFNSFMDKYFHGDIFMGYDLVDGVIQVLIHDPNTYEIKHRGTFGDNGLAKQFMEQEQRNVTHGRFIGPGSDNPDPPGKNTSESQVKS